MASAMENVATNGQAGPVAVVQGGALAVPTLLGRTAPRIPVAGRIRAGIKVLTRRAAENERVRAIYERGVEQGKSFDSIEREIAGRNLFNASLYSLKPAALRPDVLLMG